MISVLLTYFWYEPYLVHKELFMKPLADYFKRQAGNMVLTLLIGGVTYGICALFQHTAVPVFLLKVLICAVVPNLLYLAAFWKREEFQAVYKRGITLIRKRKM